MSLMLKSNRKPSRENTGISRRPGILNHSLLTQQSPPVPFKRYDVIENPPSNNSMFVISRGIAGLRNLLNDGRRSISALYVSKDIVENEIFNGYKNGYLIALTHLEGYWCELNNEDNASEEFSSLQQSIQQNLSRQNLCMIKHCTDLGKKTALERTAAFLFECTNRIVPGKKKSSIPLPLHRVDIADYLGLRQETLSRAIARLEREILIRIDDSNYVEILNSKLLKQIANGAIKA
ncbi:MAG: Crp/Fnr family transcriptional regulator [Hyphomicrobiales bacterium]|nr:Crp/Fnr family transcriptional regulator [Hyphomicrobiales bacterium]